MKFETTNDQEIMILSNDFFEYVRGQLSTWTEIDKKKMFGVLGLYHEGVMFGIISKNMVYLKVDDTNRNKFLEAGSETLKVFKNNSEVRSYYELPVEVLEDADEFIAWAKESYAIQIN